MRLGTGVLGDKPASIVFTDQDKNHNNAKSYSFAGTIFGEPAATRYIFVVIATLTGLNTTIGSVTIGGVAASLIVSSSTLHLYAAPVPTGTTGTVAISYSGSSDSAGTTIMVWAVYDLKSITPVAPPIATSLAVGVASADLSCNTRSGGIVIAAAARGANGTSQTYVGVTKDYENTSSIDNTVHSGASANIVSGQSPRTITVTSSDTSSIRVALAASFR